MLFSSAMEEASGKHYEVRFSTTQRWAVASVVLLVLSALYVALVLPAVLGIVCGAVIALAATLARRGLTS